MGLMALRRRCLMYHPTNTRKNLLNVDDSLKLMYSNYTNFTGANGTATITGRALGGWIMPCEPNTTYTYSHKCYTSGGDAYSSNQMEYRAWTYDHYPASYGDSSRTQLFSVARSDVQTFTTGADAQYLMVGFFCNWQDSMSPYLTVEQMQVELGNEATPYEPYQD